MFTVSRWEGMKPRLQAKPSGYVWRCFGHCPRPPNTVVWLIRPKALTFQQGGLLDQSGMSEGLQSVAYPDAFKALALQARVVYSFWDAMRHCRVRF